MSKITSPQHFSPVPVPADHLRPRWHPSDFDSSYAVDFWDLTNRQDWAACESVQRGLNSPHATPGPLAPGESGVYQFITRVAQAYQGGGAERDLLTD